MRESIAHMRFCCAQFEGICGFAGGRGFGIVPYRDEEIQRFILQHRALDAQAKPPFSSTPLSLISELHLVFCPWCGVRLEYFYGDAAPASRSELRIEEI